MDFKNPSSFKSLINVPNISANSATVVLFALYVLSVVKLVTVKVFAVGISILSFTTSNACLSAENEYHLFPSLQTI